MAFRSISNDYDITTEGELGAILQNFDPDMIFDVLEHNMETKYREYEHNLTNLVVSFEYSFKQLEELYGMDQQILQVRDNTYAQIVERICSFHNIERVQTEINIDTFSFASLMYEFFISRFTNGISNFFVSYIMRETESLYNMILQSEDEKKIKNNSSTYYKKLYSENPKLAIIHAYIPKVVNNIMTFDISLYEYIYTAYATEISKSQFLCSLLVDNNDFYPNHVVPFIREHYARIITDLRLTLQSFATPIFINKNNNSDTNSNTSEVQQ